MLGTSKGERVADGAVRPAVEDVGAVETEVDWAVASWETVAAPALHHL